MLLALIELTMEVGAMSREQHENEPVPKASRIVERVSVNYRLLPPQVKFFLWGATFWVVHAAGWTQYVHLPPWTGAVF